VTRKRRAFLEEWHPTLQILRDIGTTISRPENRPSWVSASAPTGTQADQFFHAHYYQRTFDGRKANYAVFFERNQGRQQQAQPRRQEETCALGRANVQSRQTRQLMWVDRRHNAPWGQQSLSHAIHERHLVPAAHEFGVLLQVTPRPTDWRVIGNIPSSAGVWGLHGQVGGRRRLPRTCSARERCLGRYMRLRKQSRPRGLPVETTPVAGLGTANATCS